jgi:hypothetical protein
VAWTKVTIAAKAVAPSTCRKQGEQLTGMTVHGHINL